MWKEKPDQISLPSAAYKCWMREERNNKGEEWRTCGSWNHISWFNISVEIHNAGVDGKCVIVKWP